MHVSIYMIHRCTYALVNLYLPVFRIRMSDAAPDIVDVPDDDSKANDANKGSPPKHGYAAEKWIDSFIIVCFICLICFEIWI